MEQEKKYFLSPDSGCDADSSAFAVAPNAWTNMENCRVGSTDAGEVGVVESVGSTREVHTPGAGYTYLGGTEDEATGRFVYALYHATAANQCILCYDKAADTVYTVLTDAQVQGGLNFSFFTTDGG